MREEAALIVQDREPREVVLSPVMNLQTAKSRLQTFQEFVAGYLQESEDGGGDGGDYGIIPGAGKKKVLLKSGADKLCELYGLYDEYEIESVENFESNLFYYKVKCILKSRRDDSVVGTGLGSCSTYESKYRWRDSQRKCPKCAKENIRKSKEGGWYCWTKTGGCGATFKDGDASIEKQTIGRVENPDILDTVNTVLKMAKKRAKIDATIGVTRSSGIFTQDIEESVATAARAVPVTQQDIPLGKPVEKPAETPSRQPGEDDELPAEKPDFIGPGQQANFGKCFREALKPALQKQAEELRHKWLEVHFYIDSDGNPSSAAIPVKDWPKARDEAVAYAKSL